MTTFDNHAPINFEDSEKLASARRDGGSYSGIGYNTYRVYKGGKYHLTHSESSGCEYNGRTDHSSEHLGCWDTKEELIAHLLNHNS